jgi:hypothetical protein
MSLQVSYEQAGGTMPGQFWGMMILGFVLPEPLTKKPMVGWVADMPSGAHATSGTATIIDDCTVSVTNFNFDGGGVVVQFFGGTGGDYGSGFAIGEDIFGTPFSDETVTLSLPDEKTLDDMDAISVWCVEFGVSFTDAMFEAP